MISIFAKEAFLNTNPHEPFRIRTKPLKEGVGHLQRVSSLIRGDQIAERIGARFNPTEGYENGICIYVKPHVKRNEDFKFEGRKAYMDVVDGWGLLPLLKKHPYVTAIACSQQDQRKLQRLIPNKVILIPQHHCNFDREKRNREGITRIGVIGTTGAFPLLPKDLREELSKRGIELETYSNFFTRQDIVDFYKRIDLQIVWRPYRMNLSNPLKIVNASSFGIPTIAYDESVFKEVEGCYIPVNNLNEFLEKLDELRFNAWVYPEYSKKCLEKAEDYHIDNIAKLYKELDK